jgi:hypothetical protein
VPKEVLSMESDWLAFCDVIEMMKEARAGRRSQLDQYLRENSLRAISDDCLCLALVREHWAQFSEKDGERLWTDQNRAPDAGGAKRQVINVFHLHDDGAGSWSKVAAPLDCSIRAVVWRDGLFVFDLGDREIAATPQHLSRVIGDSTRGGAQSEATIGRNFAKIEGAVPLDGERFKIDWDAVRAKLPLRIEDDVLGELTRQASDTVFEGAVTHAGEQVPVQVSANGKAEVTASLGQARMIVADLDAYVARAKAYAVEALLELKNDNWLDEGEEELTPEEFQAPMALSYIWCDDEGDATFVFGDGVSQDFDGLFLGHSIAIDMSSTGEFVSANLWG